MPSLALLLLLAGAGVGGWLTWRDYWRVRQAREGFLDDCLALLEAPRLTRRPRDYPRLSGLYRGQSVHIDPTVEALAFRKLPSLWLKVTLEAPTAARTRLDIMVRPLGSEYFSPFNDLPATVPTPPGWPPAAVARCDEASLLPEPEALAPARELFADPRAKELLVTPKGVRLVYQAAEGERGAYLIYRQARFAGGRLPAGLARRLLDATVAVREKLAAGEGGRNP